MKLIRIFLLSMLTLASAVALRATNLQYGPWIHQIDEHGFTVLWITEQPSLDFVEIAEDDGSAFEARTRARFYETRNGRRVTGRYHSVRIEGLQSGTVYRYRISGKVVQDDSNAYYTDFGPERQLTPRKRELTVKTLDASAQNCRFSIFNDIHFDNARFSALAGKMDVKKTDFIVLNGDIVSYSEHVDSVAKHSVVPIQAQLEKLPIVYVRGNHEGRGRDFHKVYSLFPTATGEFWYSFRQGPAAFIVLDAGEDKADNHQEYSGTADYDAYRARETAWLEAAVKDPSFAEAPVKIGLLHVPTFANEKAWYSQRWITENWAPILEKAGIDVMLSAHHHRWICSEAGQDGKAYPILVNSNLERMDVNVSAHAIEVKTFSVDGTLRHQWRKEK